MPEVASIIESVAGVLALAAVLVLAVAVVVSFVRPGTAPSRPWPHVALAITSCVFVVAVAAAGR